MLKKFLVTMSILSVASLAFAGGSAQLVAVPYVQPAMDIAEDIPTYEAAGHHVYDLQVVVTGGDRWTTTYAHAYFQCTTNPGTPGDQQCGTFWDHTMGGAPAGNLPQPGSFAYFGLLQYDSFWTSTEEWPNPDVDPPKNGTTFAPGSPLRNTPYEKEAEWYVDPNTPNCDGGTFTLERFNFLLDCEFCSPPGMTCVDYDNGQDVCCYLVVEGDMYFAATGGLPWHFQELLPVCWIPEPASVVLLALGSLALIRRR